MGTWHLALKVLSPICGGFSSLCHPSTSICCNVSSRWHLRSSIYAGTRVHILLVHMQCHLQMVVLTLPVIVIHLEIRKLMVIYLMERRNFLLKCQRAVLAV